MTRLSTYLLPTEKQPPADAEALSHKLLVRAGMARQLGAGLWTFLPAGWRVHRKVEQIIRSEQDAIGAQEMLMPVLQPSDPWHATGRYEIDELFKLSDRKGTEMVLAMTHEEAVTTHVANLVRSYRDLPLILYHLQTKERDEPRPRAGLLRTREFIMKDAYTFDTDRAGLDVAYEKERAAYHRTFERAGLIFYEVEADVGMMGGVGAHEFMAPCPAGENDVALADGYAANVEVASATAQPVELAPAPDAPATVSTPGAKTVKAVCEALGVGAGALLKAFPVVLDDGALRLVVVRGDHQVEPIKLTNALGQAFRPAQPDELAPIGPAGFLGPVGTDVPVLLDQAVADGPEGGYVCGANAADAHLTGVVCGRDFAFTTVDVRAVVDGDTVAGKPVRVEPAIEIGNIFKLGTRYSEPLGATVLDAEGRQRTIWMGSYGIGPARIMAAAVEQHADERGICWPRAIAPWDVELVALGKPGTPERELADRVYAELGAAGLDVLYDDRDMGPGGKFADAELVGCPLRITIGRRTLENGSVEAQARRGQVDHELPVDGLGVAARELWETLP